MSQWQSYIDLLLAPEDGKPVVLEAAICGHEDGQQSVWASTPGFSTISVEEIKNFAQHDRSGLYAKGPCISKMKCRLIRDNLETDAMFCMDLKSSTDENGESYNVCVGKSGRALIIAKGTKEANGGQLAKKVFNVVQYLRNNNM